MQIYEDLLYNSRQEPEKIYLNRNLILMILLQINVKKAIKSIQQAYSIH